MEKLSQNRSLHPHIIFLSGLLYVMLFSVWENSLQVMYPNEQEQAGFLSFFRGLAFIAVALCLFVPVKPAKGWLPVGATIFLLLSVGSIFTGHWFAYEIKTDEFLFYFTVAATSALAFVAVLTILIRYLFSSDGLDSLKLVITGSSGTVVGYFILYILENGTSFHPFHVWYAIIPLALLVVIFFLKEQRTTVQTR